MKNKLIIMVVICAFPFFVYANKPNESLIRMVKNAGYIFDEKSAVVTKVSNMQFVMRVFLDRKFKKSTILLVSENSLQNIGEQGFSGSGIFFDIIDITGDQKLDIIVSEYYEPELFVRIFSGSNDFKKIFQGYSSSKPSFVELGLFFEQQKAMEMILTKDEYDFSYNALFTPSLYVFDGDSYVQHSK